MSNITNDLKNIHRAEQEKNQESWVERIMRSMKPKINQQTMVHPCIINGEHTLVYENGLETKDPLSYRQITNFARLQGYQLKEDRRSDFLEGVKRVKNQRRANVMSVMMLTAGLMSQSVQANSDDAHDNTIHISTDVTYTQATAEFDFDLDSYATQEELAAGLLGWINGHSSFTYDINDLPDIRKVSAQKIAEIAFGGELPAAVNPENLNLFGLYNFNEKAVYLLDSIDLASNEGKGILLHELVHYLQYQTGVSDDAKCTNELESLAYVLEAKFLESNNQQHKITSSHISKVSQCRT